MSEDKFTSSKQSWQVATLVLKLKFTPGELTQKLGFPSFSPSWRVKEENEVSSQEKQLSAKQQSPIKVSNQLLQPRSCLLLLSLALLHTSPMLFLLHENQGKLGLEEAGTAVLEVAMLYNHRTFLSPPPPNALFSYCCVSTCTTIPPCTTSRIKKK